ncbi:MAG: CBS domain-containing protein [Anaerolineales bacterium]|nr:CBS domain-containing protein [Anaerolineales bacterium]
MSPTIPLVHQDDKLPEIVEKTLKSGLHRVIVLDDQEKPIGLISDSDVVVRIQPAQRRDVLSTLLGHEALPSSEMTTVDLMSPGVLTALPDMPLLEAARLMISQKRKWLVVVDQDNHPLGLVDRHILLRALTAG